MPRRARVALAAAAAVALIALAPPAAAPAQERVLTRDVDAPTMLSAYGAVVLWSQRGADGLYHLWYAEEGLAPARLPGIAPRAVPFDADLGPRGDGAYLAVYSRCDVEPPFDPGNDTGPPDYTSGRGCRLFEYDFMGGRERELPRHGSEMLPAVWKDTLAYVRMSGAGKPVLRVQSRHGSRSRALPGGLTRDAFDRPTALDLYGRRLAASWLFRGEALGPGSEIVLVDIRSGAWRIVDRTRGGGITTIQRLAPAFEHGALYYARGCFGDGGGCPGRAALVRYRYAERSTTTAPINVLDLWQARGGGRTWVLRDSDGFRACHDVSRPGSGASCRIVSTTPRYR